MPSDAWCRLSHRLKRGSPVNLLSLTDLFLIGLALDLVGAVALARGLLASPQLIVLRSRYGAILVDVPINTPQVIAEVEDRLAARAGIVSLALGFGLQAVGYLLSVAGVESATSGTRAVVAAGLAGLAAAGAVGLIRRTRPALLRRGLVAVALETERYWREHRSPATGYFLLEQAAEQLNCASEGAEDGPSHVRRVFTIPVYFHEATKTPHLLEETATRLGRQAEG
jgi:hypothetical protein